MGSDTPVIQGYCNGVPIRRFGFTWVLDEAPDLVDAEPLQIDNNRPRTEVHPKTSSELYSNRIGATTTVSGQRSRDTHSPTENATGFDKLRSWFLLGWSLIKPPRHYTPG